MYFILPINPEILDIDNKKDSKFSQTITESGHSRMMTERDNSPPPGRASNSAKYTIHNKYTTTEIFGHSIDSGRLLKQSVSGQRRITTSSIRKVTILNRTAFGSISKSMQFELKNFYKTPKSRAICQESNIKVKYNINHSQFSFKDTNLV